MNLNAARTGQVPIDTGSVAIPGTGTYTAMGVISLNGMKTGLLALLSNTGANAFTGVKITRAATLGGSHKDWIVDADFNTATAELLDVITGASPPNLHTLASNSSGQFKLDRLQATPEIQIWVKAAAATTATLTGSTF